MYNPCFFQFNLRPKTAKEIIEAKKFFFLHTNFFFVFSGCEVYGFWGTLGALGEIWSLSAITYDRYQSILYPLNTSKRLGTNQVIFNIYHLRMTLCLMC